MKRKKGLWGCLACSDFAVNSDVYLRPSDTSAPHLGHICFFLQFFDFCVNWLVGIDISKVVGEFLSSLGHIAALWAARPSRIVWQGYSQAGTFWGVLNLSLRAYGAQLRNVE